MSRNHGLELIACGVLLLAGCAKSDEAQRRAKGGGTPTVGFVVVQPTSVPVTVELGGRVNAFQMSEVRPQVAGILKRRLFNEGALVREGQTLYEIDPRVYRAAVNEAQANLQSARANAEATKLKAARLRPLAEMEAVAKQDFTDAQALARQAAAGVAQNDAQLQTARVNLGFTTVPAPISGRIGRSLVTVGALVTSNQVDPLAVIQRLDPIFVDIQQSSAELLALRRALSGGDLTAGSASVRLKLEDGSDYALAGAVEFAEVMVNQATGTVTLRARFPNPQGVLLPGMFVRAIFSQATDTRAFLVPQQALARDPRGGATLFVVGPGDKAVQRTVTAARTQGASWVVTNGLNPGDRVIVQGLANVKAGAAIKPVASNTPQNIAPPSPEKTRQSKAN